MYNLETLLGERVLEVFMCVRIMGWLRNTILACSMDDGLTVTVGAGYVNSAAVGVGVHVSF